MARHLLVAVILTTFTAPGRAESLPPGEYRGVVVFDRWDSCLLSNGPYVMWVSERLKETFRPFEGRQVTVNASEISQPINPGDGCVTKLGSPWGTTPPPAEQEFRLSVNPALKQSQHPTMLVSIENTSGEELDVHREIGFTLLMKKPQDSDFSLSHLPSDGPSFGFVTRQPLIRSHDDRTSFKGVTASMEYSWRLISPLPQELKLAPGMKRSVSVELSLPAGEFEFLVGSRNNGRATVSNRVAFDVNAEGVAKTVTPDEIHRQQWDMTIDRMVEGYASIKERKPVAFPEMGKRITTLFRSHPLTHVQIFMQRQGGDPELQTELYYGRGELHVVQHKDGWNLVTKGLDAYEWKHGSRSGEINRALAQELVAYTIYLTDPAYFPTYVYQKFLTEPDRFEPPVPDESGFQRLRLKRPVGGITEVDVDPKQIWYGAFGLKNEGGEVRYIFSRPKPIESIPEEVLQRTNQVRFRKGTNSLKRHRVYL